MLASTPAIVITPASIIDPIDIKNKSLVRDEIIWGIKHRSIKKEGNSRAVTPKKSPINLFPPKKSKKRPRSASQDGLFDDAFDKSNKSKPDRSKKISYLDRQMMSRQEYIDVLSQPTNHGDSASPKTPDRKKRSNKNFSEPCPPRLVQLSVPNKRLVYENWKAYADIMPAERANRFNEMLHQNQNLDVPDANFYFKQKDKERRKKAKLRKMKADKKKNAAKNKEAKYLKNQIEGLTDAIMDQIKNTPAEELTYKQQLLADKIMEDLDNPLLRKIIQNSGLQPTKNKDLNEIVKKSAVWMDKLFRTVDTEAVAMDSEMSTIEVSSLASSDESTEESTDQRGEGEDTTGASSKGDSTQYVTADSIDNLINTLQKAPQAYLVSEMDPNVLPGVTHMDVIRGLQMIKKDPKDARTKKMKIQPRRNDITQALDDWVNISGPQEIPDDLHATIEEVSQLLPEAIRTMQDLNEANTLKEVAEDQIEAESTYSTESKRDKRKKKKEPGTGENKKDEKEDGDKDDKEATDKDKKGKGGDKDKEANEETADGVPTTDATPGGPPTTDEVSKQLLGTSDEDKTEAPDMPTTDPATETIGGTNAVGDTDKSAQMTDQTDPAQANKSTTAGQVSKEDDIPRDESGRPVPGSYEPAQFGEDGKIIPGSLVEGKDKDGNPVVGTYMKDGTFVPLKQNEDGTWAPLNTSEDGFVLDANGNPVLPPTPGQKEPTAAELRAAKTVPLDENGQPVQGSFTPAHRTASGNIEGGSLHKIVDSKGNVIMGKYLDDGTFIQMEKDENGEWKAAAKQDAVIDEGTGKPVPGTYKPARVASDGTVIPGDILTITGANGEPMTGTYDKDGNFIEMEKNADGEWVPKGGQEIKGPDGSVIKIKGAKPSKPDKDARTKDKDVGTADSVIRLIKGHKPGKVFEHSPDTVCCLSLKIWAVWLLEITHNAHNWTKWVSNIIGKIREFSAILKGNVRGPDGRKKVLSRSEWDKFVKETEETILSWRQYSNHVKDLTDKIIDKFHDKDVNCCPKCLQDHLIKDVTVAHETLQALTDALNCAGYWQRCLDEIVQNTARLTDISSEKFDVAPPPTPGSVQGSPSWSFDEDVEELYPPPGKQELTRPCRLERYAPKLAAMQQPPQGSQGYQSFAPQSRSMSPQRPVMPPQTRPMAPPQYRPTMAPQYRPMMPPPHRATMPPQYGSQSKPSSPCTPPSRSMTPGSGPQTRPGTGNSAYSEQTIYEIEEIDVNYYL